MADKPRLILFDVDGTLQDSQAHIFAATVQAFEKMGLPAPTREEVRGGVGLSVEDAMARLAPDLDTDFHTALSVAYRAEFFQIATSGDAASLSPLFEGVAETLRQMAGNDGVMLGVATGKSRRGLERMLREHNLGGVFQTLQVADGHPSKPHPSMVLTAMAEMGVGPDQTTMIGDTTYDMLMAKAAGVRAIGVSWGYHPVVDLKDAGAALIVDSFTKLPQAVSGVFTE